MKTLKMASLLAASALGLSACGNKSAEQAENDSVRAEESTAAAVATVEEGAKVDAPQYGADFFEVAGDSAKYTTTPSGLKYYVVKEGTGAQPKATDVVTVHYTGRLTTGQVFDSSVERGEPAEFPLNRVIPGWTEGVQLMKEGSKYMFFIPSELAYGAQGVPNAIPPHSVLIFEVELIKVVKK